MNYFDRFCYMAHGIFLGIILVSPVLMELGVMPRWSYVLTWVWPVIVFIFGCEWHIRGPRWERQRKVKDKTNTTEANP